METKVTKWADILERSFWTALESTFAVVYVDATVGLPDGTTLQVVAISTAIAFIRNVGKYRIALWK